MQNNIYLLEDDPDDAKFIRKCLHESPYTLQVFPSLTELIEAITKNQPQAILADLNVLDSKGTDTIRRLAAYCADIPIIVTSGSIDFKVDYDLITKGVFSFINKDSINSESIQRELDFALQRAKFEAKLRRSSENKSVFISNLSHEIRNPLNAIMGMSSVLLDNCNHTQRHLVESIQTASQRILSVVNDSLDMAKIEAGELQVYYTRVNIRQILADCLKVYAADAARKSILLFDRIDSNVPCEIETDATRLKQILDNYISNAIKYTDQGRIQINVFRTKSKKIRFEVCDTGRGIARADLKRLFRPFKQLQASDQSTGSGLGLTICKKIAPLLGGRVGVSSEAGQGSNFWVTIKPRNSYDRKQSTQRRLLANYRKGLIFSKCPFVAESIGMHLAPFGMPIDIVCHQEQLDANLSLSPKPPYDFIFCEASEYSALTKTFGKEPHYLLLAKANRAPAASSSSPDVISSPFCASSTLAPLLGEPQHATPTHPLSAEERKFLKTFSHYQILVVDDDDLNRTVLANILQGLGLQHSQANCGEKAVELLDKLPDPLMVFMDCRMPGIGGFEASRLIKAKRPDALIIAITGLTLEEDLKKCYQSGMAYVLIKPVRPKELLSLMHSIHPKESRQSTNA